MRPSDLRQPQELRIAERQVVRWDEIEKEKVIARAVELRLVKLEPSLTEILNQSQESLPASRRRKLKSCVAVPYIVKEVKSRIAALVNNAKRAPRLEAEAEDFKQRAFQLSERLSHLPPRSIQHPSQTSAPR